MRSRKEYIYIIFSLLIFASSCNVSKHLPPGTYLYNGSTYKIEKDKENKTKIGKIKGQLKKITAPRPNKRILGLPYRVWLWYVIGEPKKQKGLRYWLHNKLGEPPVLNTMVDVQTNAANFKSYLENEGYFRSSAAGDTTIKGRQFKSNYKVKVGWPYTINDFSWMIDSSSNLGRDIATMDRKEFYIKQKKQFKLADIKAQRTSTDIHLKSKGYYYFSPDQIMSWVDSSIGSQKVNVFFKIKEDVPLNAVVPQTIRRIVLFPNYTLLEPPPDTSKFGLKKIRDIYIRDTTKKMRYRPLIRSITYHAGDLYDIKEHNKTLNRFINLGAFKFVKSRYESGRDTLNPRFLDVFYYLTPMQRKSLQAELAGFTKTNSFTGMQTNLNYKVRNAFRGAEILQAKVYGAFESSTSDSLSANNNFRVGGEVSVVAPRFLLPFEFKERNYFPPKTKITLGYEWMRRRALYTKNFFRFQYEFTWKESVNKEHTFAPISITFNTTSDPSPKYKQELNESYPLQLSNKPEIITGTFYNFLYNTINPNAPDIYYLNGNIDIAGNLVGLFNKATQPYTKKIFGAYFAQYAKLDFDARYTHKLSKNVYWANRLIVGAGFPHGNSLFLPFAKQFIIGGGGSVRGFLPRQLGPGRARATALQQVSYPQVGGDYKLEGNTELRFPLVSRLKGAIFADAGNIWVRDSLLYGKAGQLTKDFMEDIAVSAGAGLRLDIAILLIRFDVAIPLRKPYLEKGKEWVTNQIDFGSKAWRKENVIYTISIGYPF
jgi:outer membrane protein insertion porin family